MKHALLFASLVSASLLLPSLASANPGVVKIEINCPQPNDPTSQLSVFSDAIRGVGRETVANSPQTFPVFTSTSVPKNMPVDLKYYMNNGVDYNSRTSVVTCNYRSTANEPQPPFAISYTLINGSGGVKMNDDPSTIILQFMMGLRS